MTIIELIFVNFERTFIYLLLYTGLKSLLPQLLLILRDNFLMQSKNSIDEKQLTSSKRHPVH